MWVYLGLGAAEMLLLRAPTAMVELTARSSLWAVGKAYSWYNPHVSETKQLQIELERIRFELNELRDPDWVIIDKPK